MLPLDQWVVSQSDGGLGGFAPEGGAMEIDFRVPISGCIRSGTRLTKRARWICSSIEPVVLSREIARIGFEAIGNEWKSWKHSGKSGPFASIGARRGGEVLVYNVFPAEKFYFPKGHPATKNDSAVAAMADA